MSEKTTPMRMHEVYCQALSTMSQESRDMFEVPSDWDDLTDLQKELFAIMARDLNYNAAQQAIKDLHWEIARRNVEEARERGIKTFYIAHGDRRQS